MKEFLRFIDEIAYECCQGEPYDINGVISFFDTNKWFGAPPILTDKKILITQEQESLWEAPLMLYFDKKVSVYEVLLQRYPETARFFLAFADETGLSLEASTYVIDFLAYYLTKDLALYSNQETDELVASAAQEMIKSHGDYLTFFLAWLRSKVKTRYSKDYIMEKRYTLDENKEAYDFDTYLRLLYFLFNEEYIEQNDMIEQAATSQRYTDTWLYLAMFFVCALRDTDLVRIYHPTLPYPAEMVIEKIRNDEWTWTDAHLTLLSITERLSVLPFTPNKTARISGVSSIKFEIPTSCEELFGTLFALAQAHREIAGTPDAPIIRPTKSYWEISRIMGDDIGELFLENNFHARSANKSYLQALLLVADSTPADEDDPTHSERMNGYVVASYARSHKGSYGSFASTTFEYLKDAKLSGMSEQFVVFQLLERGVMSFIPSMLLKIATEGKYDAIPIEAQTEMVKVLDLSPNEVEKTSMLFMKSRKRAQELVASCITGDVNIAEALRRIISGEAFSKEIGCMCLLSALGKPCRYSDKRRSIQCEYEISTRSTLYLMVGEYKRIRELYKTLEPGPERDKYECLAKDLILPRLDEMLSVIRQEYGEEMLNNYENLIKEILNK